MKICKIKKTVKRVIPNYSLNTRQFEINFCFKFIFSAFLKNKLIVVILLILPLNLLAIKKEIIDNPINHFTKTHHIPDNSNIIYFKADLNNDDKAEYFISCDNESFNNGHLGRIYSVYINKNDKYLWSHKNSLTIDYRKLIFVNDSLHHYEIPILLLEEDSIWCCSCKNDIVTEFKLMDIKWGSQPHSPDIFHSILKKDSKSKHPLITLSRTEALNFKL